MNRLRPECRDTGIAARVVVGGDNRQPVPLGERDEDAIARVAMDG